MLIRATATRICCSLTLPVTISPSSLSLAPLHSLSQGAEGVPVPHGPEDALHDQLAGPAAAGGDSAGGALVPGGLDLRRVPEPRAESGPDRSRTHPRGAAVQHVSAGPMGLHDGCR